MTHNLAIIVTGEIRTFFSKGGSNELLTVIKRSKSEYSKIVIIMVVSGIYTIESLLEIYKDIPDVYVEVIDYNLYEKNLLEHVQKLYQNSSFINVSNMYLKTDNNAKNEVPNPHIYIKHPIRQLYQVHIGIDTVQTYEKNHNLQFNVIMRTRFDIAYPESFYPYLPTESVLQKISFNEIGTKFNYRNKTIQEYITWLKEQTINLPNCRVSCNAGESFGGAYMYNYISLENILNGDDNILYCFNDHFFFARRDVFFKLYDFIDIYGTISNSNIKHTFAAESQLLMACFHVNISPLMFLPNTYSIIR